MVYCTFLLEFLLTLVFHFYSSVLFCFCFLASIFSSNNFATVKMANTKEFSFTKDAEICEEIYLWISYSK